MNEEIAKFIKNLKLYDPNEEKGKLYKQVQSFVDHGKMSVENAQNILSGIFRNEIHDGNFQEQCEQFLFEEGKYAVGDNSDIEESVEVNNEETSTEEELTEDEIFKVVHMSNEPKEELTEEEIIKRVQNIGKSENNGTGILGNITNKPNIELKKGKKYRYKVVEAPGAIAGSTSDALQYYTHLLNENADDGWMYYGTQSVYRDPIAGCGCLPEKFKAPDPRRRETLIFLIFVKEE